MTHLRISLQTMFVCDCFSCRFTDAHQVSALFSIDEISQYSFVGTGDAINLQETEFGANQQFLSPPPILES